MRILLTADPIGGVWSYALELCQALRAWHASVALVTFGRALTAHQRAQLESLDNVALYETTFRLEWMPEPWDDLERAAERLLDIEGRFRPDVIHLNHLVHADLPWRVPVVSVGQPGFPAFFTRESGFNADFQLDTPEQQARFIRTKWQLGLTGGVVVSNPVPEAAAMRNDEIDDIIAQALREADAQGVKGKAVTPFLLARIKDLTGGRSLATNIALVKHNALVGARLAVALHAAAHV